MKASDGTQSLIETLYENTSVCIYTLPYIQSRYTGTKRSVQQHKRLSLEMMAYLIRRTCRLYVDR